MDKDKVKNWLDEMSNYDINHIISFIRGIYNEKCDIEEELNKYKQVLDKIKDFCMNYIYIDDRGEELEELEKYIDPKDILELLEEIE